MTAKPRYSALSAKQALLVSTALGKVLGQPRYPAGSPKGGQWKPSKGGGGGMGAPWKGEEGGAPPPWAAGGSAKPGANAPPPKIVPKNPTAPSDPRFAGNPEDVATFVRGHDPGPGLNGTPFESWEPPADWDTVEGQNPGLEMDMPPLDVPPGKHAAAGVFVQEPDGRVWVVEPTNHFGGYQHSYPKGTAEPEIRSLQANAIKEAWEESGLKVEITGVVGDYERSTSVARFYRARRVTGSPVDHGNESQSVKLVPPEDLAGHLNRSVDRAIASDALGTDITKRSWLTLGQSLAVARTLLKAGKQPRHPAGSPKGGQFRAAGSASASGPLPATDGVTTLPAKYQKLGDMEGRKKAEALTQATIKKAGAP